jgi:hypothetical protein
MVGFMSAHSDFIAFFRLGGDKNGPGENGGTQNEQR